MNTTQSIRYVVISPVRDEEAYLPSTIQSMIDQTIRPMAWIIVDDGSTDATGKIVDRYASEYPWIRVVHRPNRGSRKSGSGVMEAFYDGYKTLPDADWDFMVKLDGDLSFPADYFEQCFEEFRRDPRLGIAGGRLFHVANGQKKFEEGPMFHVRGATKIYRRKCWDDMGGLWPGVGWDAIDDVQANFRGWSTRSIQSIEVIHHRPTGGADGAWADRVKHGIVCYATGYHPLFLAASCLRRLGQQPIVTGSIAIFWGFLKGYFLHIPRVKDRSYIAYVRGQQLRRLFGLPTIWR